MNLLTPRQASLVTDDVYNTLTLNLDMVEMAKRAAASMTGVAQLFDFSSAKGYRGRSGVAIRSLMHKDINNYHAGERGQMEKRWASEFTATETIGSNTAKHTIINPAGH